MQQRLVRALTTLAVAVAATRGAEDQVPGIPVYNSGVATGIALYGDVGFPNNTAGGGTAFALTGRAGFGALGVTAMVSRINPEGDFSDNTTSVGATGNLKVFGGPLIPLSVTLQGGAGYTKLGTSIEGGDIEQWHFPVGLGFGLNIPNPALAIRPWIAPRVDISHVTGEGVLESATNTHFGLSAGVELNLLNGLGLHAAYDWVKMDGPKPSVFAAGLHYAFRVPGF
jgi:opacity protein-like surface antigen